MRSRPRTRDEIGRAGSGADEVNRHDPSPMAMAQVTLLAATRAPSSRALRAGRDQR